MAEEQSEETKQEARQFMSSLVGSGDSTSAVTGPGVDMAAWKSAYSTSNKDSALLDTFWSEYYEPNSTSIWIMKYDEPEYNENLEDTIAIATEFINKTESLKEHCFGVIHTLESLETEGLWFFNAPDPEQLFGANEDTSWFTWNQVGPEANEYVKNAVAKFLTPTDGKLNGKIIKDTQVFC